MRQRIIDINKNTRVSVIEIGNQFEVAVLYNAYPRLNPDGWDIDYSEYPDVVRVDTEMQVYGLIEEIREKYGE